MSRTLYATVAIPLPTNELTAAEILTSLAPHWAAFTAAVAGLGVPYTQELVSRINRADKADKRAAGSSEEEAA